MGRAIARRLAATAVGILALSFTLLSVSCTNPLNGFLYTWGTLALVDVKGGTMTLGDVEAYDIWFLDQTPTHSTTISDFRMSATEVTQELYLSVMGSNPSYFTPANLYTNDLSRPVENVSWNDAVKFCNALSKYAGLTPVYTINDTVFPWTVTWNPSANGYRLPTEAEWEYAARGGSVSVGDMWSGTDLLSNLTSVAWYNTGTSLIITHPVGSLASNELGLYDMAGNVWEWCWDAYDPGYYSTIASGSTNPRGPGTPPDLSPTIASTHSFTYYFVYRGGSYANDSDQARSAARWGDYDTVVWDNVGFRVVRNK